MSEQGNLPASYSGLFPHLHQLLHLHEVLFNFCVALAFSLFGFNAPALFQNHFIPSLHYLPPLLGV